MDERQSKRTDYPRPDGRVLRTGAPVRHVPMAPHGIRAGKPQGVNSLRSLSRYVEMSPHKPTSRDFRLVAEEQAVQRRRALTRGDLKRDMANMSESEFEQETARVKALKNAAHHLIDQTEISEAAQVFIQVDNPDFLKDAVLRSEIYARKKGLVPVLYTQAYVERIAQLVPVPHMPQTSPVIE